MIDRLTIRARLTLATTVIVIVAVVLLGTIAFVTVRLSLDNAFANRLETIALAIHSVADVRKGRLKPLDRDDREQFLSLLGAHTNGAILRADGHVMQSNVGTPPLAILRAIEHTGAVRGNVELTSGTFGYASLPISEDGKRYGTVAAWESRGAYDEAVSTTLLALGIAGVIVASAAAATGGFLARGMLRPVTDLGAMLSEIEATDLTERLRWTGPNDELGRLCATFDRMLDRLETAFSNERRFIADASHELRTPLSVMRAEVELALMHDRSPEAYRETLARLQGETERLEALSEGLLLMARHDAAPFPATIVDLGAAARRAAQRMQLLADRREVSLICTIDDATTILADPTTIESTIVALIDNALRFAPAQSAVRIDVARLAGQAALVVADAGPGFSDSALHEATRRFWRDDPARSGTGTGLGLAIARSIVERSRGTIQLSNARSGTGAVVTITVPTSPS